MATWRAEVFVNSQVGRITTEVEAATFSGAKQQIYAKHGDVQQITNLREVRSVCRSTKGIYYPGRLFRYSPFLKLLFICP